MQLREGLLKYKEATMKIIEYLKQSESDYIDLDNLINNRKDIIDKLNVIAFDKNEFKSISNEYGLLKYEEELIKVMQQKKSELKIKIQKSIKSKKINSYNNMNTKAVFLSREV